MKIPKDSKILVTGGTGFLGQYLVKELLNRHYRNTLGIGRGYDLRNYRIARLVVNSADIVFHLAARVGGIGENMEKPAEFFFDNLMMGVNVIESCRQTGVKKLIYAGSVCSYPDNQYPFVEDKFWDGYPEETNAAYGMSKKIILTMLQAYQEQYGFNGVYPIMANLYGLGDESSHVIPQMISKFKLAKKSGKDITLWGTGTATREFLHAKDAAAALADIMEKYDKPEPINIGTGKEISISDLAMIIGDLTGFTGVIKWDTSKPDGSKRRKTDTSKISKLLKWKPRIKLEDGIREMI